VTDYGNDTIRKLAFNSSGSNWSVTTIAGSVGKNTSTDGTNSQARFDQPSGIAADSSTPPNLFISDQWPKIRLLQNVGGSIWQSSTVSTLPPLGGNAEQEPFGITVDNAGNVYFTTIFVNELQLASLAELPKAPIRSALTFGWR
jgi:hypothetical protein